MDCMLEYGADNYNSIMVCDIGHTMSVHLEKEIEDKFVTVVDKPCICIHPYLW